MFVPPSWDIQIIFLWEHIFEKAEIYRDMNGICHRFFHDGLLKLEDWQCTELEDTSISLLYLLPRHSLRASLVQERRRVAGAAARRWVRCGCEQGVALSFRACLSSSTEHLPPLCALLHSMAPGGEDISVWPPWEAIFHVVSSAHSDVCV